MKEKITPCLWYNGQAREAADLYCSVFANAEISTQSPIVTNISVDGQSITLLDGGPMFRPNPSISFYYIAETEEELSRVWNGLSKEGKVMMELARYPWAEKYGWLSDKFDVSWQIGLGKISDVGQKITPALMFVGKQYGRVDEVIEVYSRVFGNVTVDGILRYPAGMEPDKEGKVQHAQVKMGNQKLMIMESAHKHDFQFSEGVSLTIHCENQEEIDHYWNGLTEGGGEESMCGWLKDKFGVSWQVIPVVLSEIMNDPNKAGKAAQAFMSMKKLNIEQIVNASNR